LLYYIFADDTATAPVIAALGRAAKRGVACRVLVDSLGYRAASPILTEQARRGYRMVSILCYKIEVVIGALEISKNRCQMASAGLNSTRRIHAGGDS
jgi:hypothetical protein